MATYTYRLITNPAYPGKQSVKVKGLFTFDEKTDRLVKASGPWAEGDEIKDVGDFLRLLDRGNLTYEVVSSVEKGDTVYKVVAEQTAEEVGFVLVDKDSDTLVGYAGDHPPVGFVQDQPFTQFREANRGYILEEQEAEEVRAEVDTTEDAAEAARLVGIAAGAALQASGVISKADEEQQIVYGWAYVTHDRDGNVVVDKSGDFIDEVEQIEKSAIQFMLTHRASDLDHTNVKGGEVVESMVFTPEKMEAMGIAKGSLPSGWWIGVKCSDEQWAGYKAGRTAFSIHGSGTRKAAE